MRVMIIDNDKAAASEIAEMLSGYYTEIEHDSLDAVARLVSATLVMRGFDVVVCELDMRGMPGREVAAALRNRIHAPIIVLFTRDPEALASYAPADAILLYPFHANQLLAAIGHAREARASATTRRMRLMAAR